ncbi:uncharacterized protein LOC113235763 [Hyposmocoma kahamanoa]|uniref:uncharacterized protein LOC113235763 n=1 Tax=Hyposmocoma kahamanoa TaxID=1477025 RepID=UPI000E6D8A59|nr:uncharacterized protein LOC113235763 [Hyposmocoma kahamanoa]
MGKVLRIKDDAWRRPETRRRIIEKIDEVVHRIGVEMEQTSIDIENLAYLRANNRQDYMYMIYRSIISNMEIARERNADFREKLNKFAQAKSLSTRTALAIVTKI